METTANWSFVEAAIDELISPKISFYSLQDLYKAVSKQTHLKCEAFTITHEQPKNNIKAFYVSQKNNSTKGSTPCIIYLHGLSSYVFEGGYLIPHLGTNYSMCLYDLRGHGRNESEQVTYGLEESQDLYRLIEGLSTEHQVQEFYLWGRSMGAATCLNFLKKVYSRNQSYFEDKIKGVVLDSPFSSFSKIAQEILSSNAHLPAFIASIIVNSGFSKIQEQHKINFHELDFTNLSHVKCPAVFVYSSRDDVVGPHHAELIMSKYGGKISRVSENFTHNQIRSSQLVEQIMKKMAKELNRAPSSYTTLLSLTPKKPIGLSVSISQSNSARKHHKSTNSKKTPPKVNFTTPNHHEGPRMKENQPLTCSVSLAPKPSIHKRKNLKILTSKKIMQAENSFSIDNQVITPVKKIQIPKPKSSVPAHHISNKENLPMKPFSTWQPNPLSQKQIPRFSSNINIKPIIKLDLYEPLSNRRYM